MEEDMEVEGAAGPSHSGRHLVQHTSQHTVWFYLINLTNKRQCLWQSIVRCTLYSILSSVTIEGDAVWQSMVGALFHWTVELLHPLTHLRSVLRHFSLIRHNRTVARASVLWCDINWLIDWLIAEARSNLSIAQCMQSMCMCGWCDADVIIVTVHVSLFREPGAVWL